MRPDIAPIGSDGKSKKYLNPPADEEPRHLYFVSGSSTMLKDVTVPTIFVESEIAAIACTVAAERGGRRALFVACGGVNGWQGNASGDFGHLELKTRECVVAFDGDARDKPEVRKALRKFATFR